MKSPTEKAQPVALATIGAVADNDTVSDPISVHFNPVSLQLQVSNELKDTGNGQRTQYIAKTTTKLTMDLIFDTTDTGTDVTQTTRKLQAFLAPPPPADKSAQQTPPPVVLFSWGTLAFKGIAENYKETIDFFSANGVPLRSSINLTLSRQDAVLDQAKDAPKDAGGVDDDLFDAPTSNAADFSLSVGAPGAARAVAAANGQESLRFGAGAGLTVSGSIQLKPPVAFASASAGLSLGAGGSVGVSLGASASAGIGVSASAGIAGMASLSATEGAFAGLRVSTSGPSSVRIDPSRLIPTIASSSVATDAGATFKVGGQASFAGAAGLRADVGANGKLSFDAT